MNIISIQIFNTHNKISGTVFANYLRAKYKSKQYFLDVPHSSPSTVLGVPKNTNPASTLYLYFICNSVQFA